MTFKKIEEIREVKNTSSILNEVSFLNSYLEKNSLNIDIYI